jgi:hypothetical protein
VSDHPQRCRLCTVNDREALIEQLARELWVRHRGGMDNWRWEDCGAYWQTVFMGLAWDFADLTHPQ